MNLYERVYQYMKEHGSLTPFEATTEIGIIDLARTISYMRKNGYDDIIGKPEKAVNRYGDKVRYYRYSLKGETDEK